MSAAAEILHARPDCAAPGAGPQCAAPGAGPERAADAGLRALADAMGAGRLDALALEPDTAAQDLARLALGLMEFLRQLMELQAIRRLEAGSLTEDEEERLGLTLQRSAEAIRLVAARFGLGEDDLSLRLGALGRLT